MRTKWEIKRIGDICEVIGGSTPRTNIDAFWNGLNFWITPAELYGSKWIHSSCRKITDYAIQKTNLKLLPAGTVLLSSRAPIGKVAITSVPMYCNQGFKNIVCSKSILNEYVYYFLTHNVEYIKSLGQGATFKEISKKVVENILIPTPPLEIQEHIIHQLNLLSSIINNKKKQLEELDKLAKAIFYDMFGDPITNEKGWKERSLTDVCTNLFAGGDVPKGDYSETKTEQHSIPILSNGVGDKALYGYTSKPRVNEVSLTISGRGTIGYCEVRTTPFLPVVRLIVATPNTDIILPITLKFIVDALKLKGTGGTIPQLTIPMIKNKKVFLPPIGIQQEFASKIEALEKQKELIKLSLSETEMLFNSRMDYYFN